MKHHANRYIIFILISRYDLIINLKKGLVIKNKKNNQLIFCTVANFKNSINIKAYGSTSNGPSGLVIFTIFLLNSYPEST